MNPGGSDRGSEGYHRETESVEGTNPCKRTTVHHSVCLPERAGITRTVC